MKPANIDASVGRGPHRAQSSSRDLAPSRSRNISGADSSDVDHNIPTAFTNAHNFSVQNLTVAETYVQNNYHSVQGTSTEEPGPAKRVTLEPVVDIETDKYRHEHIAVEFAVRLYEKLRIHPLCPRAIFYPNPDSQLSSPEHYLRNGILPGHVGYFTPEGSFQYLFNIASLDRYPPSVSGISPKWLLEQSSSEGQSVEYITTPINGRECVPATAGLTTRVFQRPTGEVTISVKSSEGILPSHGAALMLPERGSLLSAKNWAPLVDWARTRGRYCIMELARLDPSTIDHRLLVVSHVLKASAWGIVSFVGATAPVEFTLTHDRDGITREEVISPDQRGPSFGSFFRAMQYDRSLCNQGMALAGTALQVSPELREKIRQRVAAERGESSYNSELQYPTTRRAGPHFKGKSKASGAEDDLVQNEGRDDTVLTAPSHPSDAISDWLFLQKPKAELSIVHDKDWLAVLNSDDLTIPKPDDLLKRVQAVYEPEYMDSTKDIVTLRRKKVYKPLLDPQMLEFAQMSLW